jgi:hypothetical protein
MKLMVIIFILHSKYDAQIFIEKLLLVCTQMIPKIAHLWETIDFTMLGFYFLPT